MDDVARYYTVSSRICEKVVQHFHTKGIKSVLFLGEKISNGAKKFFFLQKHVDF